MGWARAGAGPARVCAGEERGLVAVATFEMENIGLASNRNRSLDEVLNHFSGQGKGSARWQLVAACHRGLAGNDPLFVAVFLENKLGAVFLGVPR